MNNTIDPQDLRNWSNVFHGSVLSEGEIPNFAAIMTQAKEVGDKVVWALIGPNGLPSPNVMCRNLFTYALQLCETDPNLKKKNTTQRLNTVLQLADQMQVKEGRQAGQFYKNWREMADQNLANIDPNMAEFCMFGAVILWKRHQRVLPAPLKVLIREMMAVSVGAIKASRVPPQYTNISLLNTLNLMLLGDILALPSMVAEGQNRFDRFCMYTKNWGIHEYCSATYTGVQVSVLGLIERFVPERSNGAKNLLELYWIYIATNWLKDLTRLGGTNSRQIMSFLQEDGGIDGVMKVMGWPGTEKEKVAFVDVYPALAQWYPSDALKQAVEQGFPHQIRHSWGVSKNRARTHFVCEDITLSVSGANYDMWVGSQIPQTTPQFYTPQGLHEICEDMTFTVDFTNYPIKQALEKWLDEFTSSPGDSLSVASQNPGRCYFVPDDNDNPYGKNQYNNTHICPLLWTAAQHETDALGLVLYSLDNRKNSERPLASHFVMPHGVAGFWMGEKHLSNLSEHKHPISLDPEEAVVLLVSNVKTFPREENTGHSGKNSDLRYEAVGIKVLWSQGLTGQPAPVHFHVDGKESEILDAVRLTVNHVGDSGDPTMATAGALFWVRVGHDLTLETFETWRKTFNDASPDVLIVESAQFPSPEQGDETVEGIWHFESAVRGVNGNLISINAVSPDGGKFVTSVEPPFSQSVLEINGEDVGKIYLDEMPFIQKFEQELEDDPKTLMTQDGYWEAEDGRVYPPMVLGKDQNASKGTYVWMNPTSLDTWEVGSVVGSVTWRLQIPQTSTYYIWGRLIAPQTDAFLVRIYHESNMKFPFYVSPWTTRTSLDWKWMPMILSPLVAPDRPTALVLPRGEVRFELFPQVACGAKIDRLFITTDLKDMPK